MAKGVTTIKLETSLIPSRPRPTATASPAANAGRADNTYDISNHPWRTHILLGSQTPQSSAPFLQGSNGCLLSGSECRIIIEPHQKYLIGRPELWRFIRRELNVTPAKRMRPMKGRIILQRNAVITALSKLPTFGAMGITCRRSRYAFNSWDSEGISDRAGARFGGPPGRRESPWVLRILPLRLRPRNHPDRRRRR